jgi:alpha-L-fucosidase
MKKLAFIVLLVQSVVAFAQAPPKPFGALPTAAQLNWHKMEMYCIIHFGVDTYTDKEWGYGDEDPKLINPVKFDAKQIVGAAKAGGFKGIIVVAKHHDGLCLWPTATTEYNITKAAWKNGKGDMVKEYQLACRQLGMQLGLYCSPWDRNSAAYGTPAYLNIYTRQLKELYSNYGKLFISWHDGANGGDGYYGGAREARKIDRTTYYDWPNTWAITRCMQPGAVLFGDVGPDVRWVGNEEGNAAETSWATYDPEAPEPGKTPANGYSKYEDAPEGTLYGKHWMPAECDVPFRPGWFYHPAQNGQAKSPYTLLDLYYKSVGRGAALDLGIAPNRDGLLEPDDVASLAKFGSILKEIFSTNLAKGAKLAASNVRANSITRFGPHFLLDNDTYSYWATDDNVKTPSLTISLAAPKSFNVIRLRENIKLGQRIEEVAVDAFLNNKWVQIASATSIGANRLIRLPQNITTNKVRLRIIKSPVCIALSDFGLFKEPVHVTPPAITRTRAGEVSITTDAPVAAIYYTLDSNAPTSNSAVYKKPFALPDGGTVKAAAIDGKQNSEITTAKFGLSKAVWKIIPVHAAERRGGAQNAIDDNRSSLWSTLQRDTSQQFTPTEIDVDMGESRQITSFTYLPRQDKRLDGTIDRYAFFTSTDGIDWQSAVTGEFSNIRANPIEQHVKLAKPVNARYFRFRALHVVSGNGLTAAEIGLDSK